MRVAQWARLKTPARCGLRWGAWYPVMAVTPREVQLWVRGRNVPLARTLLELRSMPPREWAVAQTPGASDPYLVCPSCRHRAHLPDGRVATLRCPRCNELFAIAWDDTSSEPRSRATTLPVRDELKPDHRMTRRRMPHDRRTGDERRDGERRAIAWVERRVNVYRRSGSERRGIMERRHRATTR